MTPRRLSLPNVHPRRRLKAVGLIGARHALLRHARLDGEISRGQEGDSGRRGHMAKIRRTCRVQHRRAVALRARPSLRSAKPLVQWLRSGLMIVTTGFNFVALRYLQLDQTVTTSFSRLS